MHEKKYLDPEECNNLVSHRNHVMVEHKISFSIHIFMFKKLFLHTEGNNTTNKAAQWSDKCEQYEDAAIVFVNAIIYEIAMMINL